MAASPKAIGKWVTQAVHRPEAYAILGPMIPKKRNSWTRGGCCVLAMALQRYLRRGRLMMLQRDGELVHVVLELDGYFIDADGAHTEDELENEWGRVPTMGSIWRNAIVLPFDGEKLAHDGVECPDPTPIVRYFRKVGKGVRFSSAGGPWYGGGMVSPGSTVPLIGPMQFNWRKSRKTRKSQMKKDSMHERADGPHGSERNPELAAIWNYASDMADMVNSETDLPEWAQHKIAAARVHMGDVKEFIEKNIAEQEANDPEGIRFSGG